MPKIDRPGLPDSGPALAVNIYDLGRVDLQVRQVMLMGRIHFDPIRFDDDKLDEVGVAFSCSLLEAAVIGDTIRVLDRQAGDPPARLYLRKETTWRKLPADAVLVVKGHLNSTYFEAVVAADPLPKRRLIIGKEYPS
jgi:hypothetical protein